MENKQRNYTLSYYKNDRKIHLLDKNTKTIADCLKLNAKSKPDREAVVFAGNDGVRLSVTFKELYEQSLHVAERFVKLGVRQSEYVIVSVRTCPEWLFVFFGVIFSGAHPISFSFTYKDGSDVIAMMQKLRTCSTIILDPGEEDESWKIFNRLVRKYDKSGAVVSDQMPYLRYLICIKSPADEKEVLTLSDMMAWETISADLPSINPEDAFALFQTSGSTGIPKAVVHTHESFIPAAISWVDALRMDSNSIYFNDRPFGWGGGFPSTVFTGQTRVTRLESSSIPEDYPSWLFEVIQKEGCTHMYALPFTFHSILERQVGLSF